MRRLLPVVLVALCAIPSAGSAQGAQAELQPAFRDVAMQWARGDASAMVRLMAPAGVSIDVSDGPMGPLSERQAAALLRQLFEQGETVGVTLGMLERVGGSPPRAFGAITWTIRPRGTQVPVRRTVYFELQWVRDAWKVSEIRLIP